MRRKARAAFSLFELLVVIAILAILFGLLLPAVVKVRQASRRVQSQNNLKQMALACHNYHDVYRRFPPGNDANNFSARARLLPFIEQANLYNLIDFKKPVDDPANARVRATIVKTYLSPDDPLMKVSDKFGATNYLFSSGSKFALKDNDGVFFQDSGIRIADITDGTSNTVMIGETLKGDGSTRATDVKRQYVKLGKDALDGLKEQTGVEDFKKNRHIAGDRCASWMDGRFLQGTFTGTLVPNDPRPDISCGGLGGTSALRSFTPTVNLAFCDGSVRAVMAGKIKLETWKLLVDRNDGQVINFDF